MNEGFEMKKTLLLCATLGAFMLSGCATNNGPTYDGSSYRQIKTYEIGTVQNVRPVVISDNGAGTFIGALVGAVLGSTIGQGNGSTLASLAGGLGGAYVGSEVGKANASELSVRLDDGRDIVVVVKGNNFRNGDRVKIIKNRGKVDQVYIIN